MYIHTYVKVCMHTRFRDIHINMQIQIHTYTCIHQYDSHHRFCFVFVCLFLYAFIFLLTRNAYNVYSIYIYIHKTKRI